MAVLEAVRGWEELAGLPHINDVGKDKEGDNKDEVIKQETVPDTEEPLEEGIWTDDQLQDQLDALLATDYVSLLLEHEEFIQAPIGGSICTCHSYSRRIVNWPSSAVFEFSSYLPESFLPAYEDFKDTLVSSLQKFGILSGGSDGAGSLIIL